MTIEKLSYAEVDKALIDAVPEIRPRLEKEFEWRTKIGGHPKPYDVVLFVLKPLLKELIDLQTDDGLLQRIFDFLEQMARSSDLEVVNLLQVGIFEELVGEPERLSVAWKYMGKETKAIAQRTAKIRRCEQNVPTE